jgi:hypothetical protein
MQPGVIPSGAPIPELSKSSKKPRYENSGVFYLHPLRLLRDIINYHY